jgi:glycosyltransferase involved in cell wall biosynthesis
MKVCAVMIASVDKQRSSGKVLTITAPTRYVWRFHGPRASRHRIVNRDFLPLSRVAPRLDGVTTFVPWPVAKTDLYHALNRIPLGFAPYVIGFESHLPRGGAKTSAYFKALTRSLLSSRCRGIIGLSDSALQVFRDMHGDSGALPDLEPKLIRRYPNVVVPGTPNPGPPMDALYRATFVGNHFGRKGGCVAVRLAELARERQFPLQVEIVSALQCGGSVWTDPQQPGFFDKYLRLLDLPNVVLHRRMENAEVVRLLADSHLSLLPTFSDSFGFSALESMAVGTPVLATAQFALREFITPENGVLLPLEVDGQGLWVHHIYSDRSTEGFATMFEAEVERLAQEAFAAIVRLYEDPAAYAEMRLAAWRTAAELFDARSAQAFWDDYYIERLEGLSPTPQRQSRPRPAAAERRVLRI